MKKIMFYINTLGNGGAERAICNTASYFAEHGWSVILLTTVQVEGEYCYSNKIRRIVIEEKNLKQSTIRRNITRIRFIRNLCKKEQIEVIVSFMREPNVRALLAAIGLQTKSIISVRSDPNREYSGKIGRFIGRKLYLLADGVVFQTQDAKAWFPLKIQRKAAIIYNVVDPIFFSTRHEDENYIVTVGRISPEKNHVLLVKAFKRVHDQLPNEKLVICGDKKNDDGIKKVIEDTELQDAVILLGQQRNVAKILSQAKLFVLSSDYEGLPNALMEAMAMGIPAISTNCPCGGPRELFGEELYDWLIPVGDEAALAEKMIKLLASSSNRKQIGTLMRKRADSFQRERVGRKWEDYVEKILYDANK